MRYCPNCGAPYVIGSRFCGQCARPLEQGPRSGRSFIWVGVAGALVLFMVVMGALAEMLSVGVAQRVCPPVCAPPPVTSPPLPPPLKYTSARYGYSLEYSETTLLKSAAIDVRDDTSIGWNAQGFPFRFTAERAGGRDSRAIADQMQRTSFPEATSVYTIPNAELGYTPGFGEVYDVTLASGTGQSIRARLVIVVAVKKNLAVEFWAVGPYQLQQESHPSPAATPLVLYFSDILNTVTWPNDPPL